VFQALAGFVRSNAQTLTLTFTPKGRVSLMSLIQAGQGGADAAGVLAASFDVTARVGP
jgi:hypothetical protein